MAGPSLPSGSTRGSRRSHVYIFKLPTALQQASMRANAFSLWQDGELVGKVVSLEGDIESSGAKLEAPPTLLPLITGFLQWTPVPPRNAKKLAEVSARLCQLLRDEVVEQMEIRSPGLTALAKDWRRLLFPGADDAQFADGYAQAVTFGLLVARALDIPLGSEPNQVVAQS